MTAGRAFGDYLRARRELLDPADVGLPAGEGRRRVRGLRRSEVALLAGISSEYYVKLEQGREVHPTDQVLDALSRALQLDATARSYLASLVRLPSLPDPDDSAEDHEAIRWLIDSWPVTPAMVLDRDKDIVAANALMRALIPAYREAGNCYIALLLGPTVRALYGADWEGITARTIALLRANAGPPPYSARMQQIVDELMSDSERFREVWPRNDVYGRLDGTHHLTHPRVGELSLRFVRLPLAELTSHSIFLYYAEPDTSSSEALRRLAAEG
jgi:transcriptional regulator with XRE-family HTH domain